MLIEIHVDHLVRRDPLPSLLRTRPQQFLLQMVGPRDGGVFITSLFFPLCLVAKEISSQEHH